MSTIRIFPRRLAKPAPTLLSLLLLAACATPPADAPAPALRIPAMQALPDQAATLAKGQWPGANWWQDWGDAQLTQLVQSALAQHPSLQLAAARLAAAQAARQAQAAADGGGVRAELSANQQHYSANGLLPPPIGGKDVSAFQPQLQWQQQLDWWGKNRALVSAAAGEEQARRAESAMATQQLALAVTQQYLLWQSAQA